MAQVRACWAGGPNSNSAALLTPRARSLVKWEREVHQAGARDLLEVLEKLTREFLDHAQYRDDRRYLRMWMLYADHVSEPVQIFRLLQVSRFGAWRAGRWRVRW